jgi:hypothetical protein
MTEQPTSAISKMSKPDAQAMTANPNMMMEMVRMSMVTNLISSMTPDSDSKDSLIFKILQLALILGIDVLIKSVTGMAAWMKEVVEKNIRRTCSDDRYYTDVKQFKYHMIIEDPVYLRLVMSELMQDDMLDRKYQTKLTSDKCQDKYFTDKTLSGALSQQFLQSKKCFIRLQKIKKLDYIYFTHDIIVVEPTEFEKRFGYSTSRPDKITCGIACNTRNKDLIDYLDGLQKKHKLSMEKLFTPTCYDSNGDNYKMESMITFDNIFFEQKENVIEIINRFNDKEWYTRKNLPHHLGMLVHGPPGASKTSFVKAMTRLMKKDLYIMDCSKVKTKKDFSIAIKSNQSRIILLEDFDRIPSVLTSTDDDASKDGESKDISMVRLRSSFGSMKSGKDKDKIAKLIQQSEDELDLAFILNLLDGVVEMPGRVLIFTANHPERIDPALMRSGRIDHIIHFKKLTKKIIAEILNHFFNTTEMSTEVKPLPDTSRIADYAYTHSEVYGLAKKYNNLATVLKMLEDGKIDLGTSALDSSK